MAFKVKHLIECDMCGVSIECGTACNESQRKSQCRISGYIRYKGKEFCDSSCKQMYIDFNKNK